MTNISEVEKGRLKMNFDFDPVYSCGATKRRDDST